MPRRAATWHRVCREDGRIILKGETKAPGRGVWWNAERGPHPDQRIVTIVNGGHVVKVLNCYCGQHLHNALVLAAHYL